MRQYWIGILATATFALGRTVQGQADDRIDLTGTYVVETGGTDEKPYTGSVTFKKKKTVVLPTAGQVDLWELLWTLTLHNGNTAEIHGIGVMLGNTLFAAYGGKKSNYNLWLFAPLGLSQGQKDAMVARHADALQRAERRVRNWGWVEDRSLFGELKPNDNYIAYGIGSDFDVEMATGSGSLSPVEGIYTDHGVWLSGNGKRSGSSDYTGQIRIKREGETLTINWKGRSYSNGHVRDYDLDGTGIEFGEGLFAAIQGAAYGEDTNAGVNVYEVSNGRFVGRYADNGETMNLYKEILVIPPDVAARAPAFFTR